MTTLTPHADGAREALRLLKEKHDAMAPVLGHRARLEKTLTLSLQEAVLLHIAEAKDAGAVLMEIGPALSSALANMMGSVALTLSNGNPIGANEILNTLSSTAYTRALDRVARLLAVGLDQHENAVFVGVKVPQGGTA